MANESEQLLPAGARVAECGCEEKMVLIQFALMGTVCVTSISQLRMWWGDACGRPSDDRSYLPFINDLSHSVRSHLRWKLAMTDGCAVRCSSAHSVHQWTISAPDGALPRRH